MLKKSFSKLLSILLTIAICATTVFSCFTIVNAQNTPSYFVSGAKCELGQKTASAKVEFTFPDGISLGFFTIDNNNSWYESVEVSLYSEPIDSTDKFNCEIDNGNVLFYFTDADGSEKTYHNFVLKLDFAIAGSGLSDSVKISLSELEFVDRYGAYVTGITNNSTDDMFTVGCQHQFETISDAVYESTDPEYTVYSKAKCKLCGEVKDEYQVVPDADVDDGEIISYSGDASSAPGVSLADSTIPNSESNPYIIELPTQLHALAAGALKNAAGENVSEIGAYFKIKDGIKAFVMQNTSKYSAEEIMSLSSWDEVFNKFDFATTGKQPTVWWPSVGGSSGKFSGHLDGNGVEIYGVFSGVYNASGNNSGARGLFTTVYGDSSFKNLSVKNSYIAFNNWLGGGALVGATGVTYLNTSTTVHNVDRVEIENCVVSNNYIAQLSNNQARGASAFVGTCTFYTVTTDGVDVKYNDEAIINNCLIYGNKFDNSIYENATGSKSISGLISYGGGSNATRITNTISLGVTPWTLNGGGYYIKQINDGTINNVYTDASQADWDAFAASNGNNTTKNAEKHNINFALSTDSFKGDLAASTASVLDWNTSENPDGVWFTGNVGQYPSLLKKTPMPVADSTDYAWELLGVNLTYNDDGSFALNFHYLPSYDTNVSLYLSNAKESYKSQVLTNPTTSSLAGNTLPDGAMMFTLNNLSARNLGILWLATIVTTSSDKSLTVYSETEQISVGGYAEDVVIGNAFYSATATEEEKAADKKVAAALINYGVASDNALNVNTYESSTATIVEKWDRYENGKYIGWYNSTLSGFGTQKSPYIIDTAEKLAYVCTQTKENAGVYYKVDDSIKAFDMNTSGLDLSSDDLTGAEVEAMLADSRVLKDWTVGDNNTACFAGNFDGNGVTIYGLRAGIAVNTQGSTGGYNYPGLFNKIDTSTATFKNFAIKNSYFAGVSAGAVFGFTNLSGGSAVIDSVVVANCYIGATDNNLAAGVIAGYCNYNTTDKIVDKVLINNCLVYGNKVVNKNGNNPRLIGKVENWHKEGTADGGNGKYFNPEFFKISNTIAIDCEIEKNNYWANRAEFYSNCYTTQSTGTTATTVAVLSSANDAKGIAAKTNMPDLDWKTTWLIGAEGEYPSIVLTAANVNPVSKYSGTPDATSTLAGSGTEDDPYIVETADQFASIALGKRTTENLYFKVKDGIESFYMQGGEEAANLTSAAEVKAYFENKGIPTSSTWAKTANFKGHFDGNGVTISGLFAYNVGEFVYVGLFPVVEGHTSIKNITIKNSYISANTKDALGALVGATPYKGDGNSNNSVTFENIAVINNYICHRTNNANGASAVGGSFFDKNYASINGAIIYGNDIDNTAYTGNGLITGLVTSNGGIGSIDSANNKYQNIIALGVTPWVLKDNGDGTYSNANWYLANLDQGLLKNVYTDQSVAALQIYNSTKNSDAVLEKYNINVVNAADLQGNNVVTTMAAANLAWGETWFAGNYNEYPSFTPAGSMPSDIYSQYDLVEFDKGDITGPDTEYLENGSMSFGVYQTALSLKANPYMSFAFAFHGDYKTNREKIQIRFTYTVNGTPKTSVVSVPEYTGEDIKSLDGWTNSSKNGRYHTYKATNIPVEALANEIKVEANYDNTGWKDFGTYSVAGLGIQFEREYRLNPCDYYATRVEATKALLFYAQAISARYGA